MVSMSTTYNTLKLVFDAPKREKTYSYVHKTVIANAKTGNVQPVRLDFNGKTVWSSANVAVGDEINKADALPGINELTWHYDTPKTSNWVQFRYHQLQLGTSGGDYHKMTRGVFIWSALVLAAMPAQAGGNFSFLGQMVRVI